MKGGRTPGTWETGSKWQHGETQVIRVPRTLTPQILEYARALDRCIFLPPGLGDILNKLMVLQAIDEYIEWKRQNYHPNQSSRELDINTRAWDELRKFRAMVERGEREDMGTRGIGG